MYTIYYYQRITIFCLLYMLLRNIPDFFLHILMMYWKMINFLIKYKHFYMDLHTLFIFIYSDYLF